MMLLLLPPSILPTIPTMMTAVVVDSPDYYDCSFLSNFPYYY